MGGESSLEMFYYLFQWYLKKMIFSNGTYKKNDIFQWYSTSI